MITFCSKMIKKCIFHCVSRVSFPLGSFSSVRESNTPLDIYMLGVIIVDHAVADKLNAFQLLPENSSLVHRWFSRPTGWRPFQELLNFWFEFIIPIKIWGAIKTTSRSSQGDETGSRVDFWALAKLSRSSRGALARTGTLRGDRNLEGGPELWGGTGTLRA